jgi:hypothetical protein
MIDVYIRTENEKQFKDEFTFFVFEEDGLENISTFGDGYVVDVIGSIVTSEGEYEIDDEGEVTVTKEPVVDDRFHVNIRLEDESLYEEINQEFVVHPSSPKRVWL